MPHDLLSWRTLIAVCCLLLAAARTHAQQSPGQGIYLVFPFENSSSVPRLEWLSEGLEELTIQSLGSARQQVYSHAGRMAELERNGLPAPAKISRASMLRVAQDLDVDYVIFGSFTSDGKTLTVESRLLRTDPLGLLPAVRETGPLDSIIDLQTRIVWKLLTTNGHDYHVPLTDFAKTQPHLRLDAFEHYVRGLLATEDEARLRELREASRLEPAWADPYFALGETYFLRNDCGNALPFLAHVPASHSRYIEALFSTGVCRLQISQPERAEEVFTTLANALKPAASETTAVGTDVPEILNNLAIARARQGKLAAAQADLRRATDLDPDEDDYPFNLGLLSLQTGDFSSAAANFREAAERHPENPEDRALLVQALEKSGRKTEADEERESTREALGPNALSQVHMDAKFDLNSHLARLRTELDTAALRLEVAASTGPAHSDAASGASDTAAAHVRHGRQELTAGQLDAAEAEFRSVLPADPGNAAAHRGLAEILHRRGKLDEAVRELQASLQLRDSAVVRTMLARIYLEQKKPDFARAEAQRALKLAPNYSEAKQLLEHLQTSKPNGGA